MFDFSVKASTNFAAIAALWPKAQYAMEPPERRLARSVNVMKLVEACQAALLPRPYLDGLAEVDSEKVFQAYVCANSFDLWNISKDMVASVNYGSDDLTRRIFYEGGSWLMQPKMELNPIPAPPTFGE